jgi:hypothetical protein
MANNIEQFVTLIRRTIKEVLSAEGYKFLQGVWNGAEAEDANLSNITIEGLPVRWAPKLEHVTGLAAGDKILCVHGPALPVTIIGILVGDITVAGTTPGVPH